MKICNFVTAYWNSREEARAKGEGQFGLLSWLVRDRELFSPEHSFIACGTDSNVVDSPLPANVVVVNSGLAYTRPYDHFFWSYSGAAYTAAFAYALRLQWNLLVTLDNDCLVGAVDFDALLREFIGRPELLLTPDWHGRPGGPFIAWKREGAARWLHMRRRANLIEPCEGNPFPPLIEDEMGEIFKDSWWNPWPEFTTLRADFGLDSAQYVGEREPLEKEWPFVRLPNPAIIEEYLATQTSRAKSVVADASERE